MTSNSFFRAVIPFRVETFRSAKSPKEIQTILDENTEVKRLVRWGKTPNAKLFEGQIEEDSFQIYRILTYLNSFRPTISGKLAVSEDGGSRLDVTFRLELFVYAFLVVWTIILVPAFVILFPEMWKNLGAGAILGVAGLFFFFAAVLAAFHYERKKASDLLIKLLSLEASDSTSS